MKILIEDYQSRWGDDFLVEREIICSTLVEYSPTIEHIGSTSVAGLCAKPTIDILVGLPADNLLDQTISPMILRGYTYFKKYEPAMPYRRLFSRLKPLIEKTVPEVIDIQDEFVRGLEFIAVTNIHILVEDSVHWKRHLAFRDYLRTHPEVRDEYGRIKKELSHQEFRDSNDYNDAKANFVKKTESQALAWYQDQNEMDGNR